MDTYSNCREKAMTTVILVAEATRKSHTMRMTMHGRRSSMKMFPASTAVHWTN